MRVIVIAGGSLPRDLRDQHPSGYKALLPFAGQSLLAHAVSAAAGSGAAQGIAVVGAAPLEAHTPAEADYVEAGRDVIENILRGFLHHGADLSADYLVLSPDLPFIHPAALNAFVATAREQGELGVPIVTREDFLARFPGAPNRFERISGRAITMGSALYMSGRMLKTNLPLWRDFYNARKFPHRLAAMLGLPIALGYLSGRLRLEALEARASQLCGGPVRAVEVSHAELAYDVDTRANYEFALAQAGGER